MRKFTIRLLQYLHGVFIFIAIFSGLSEVFSLFQPDQRAVFLRAFIVFVPFFATAWAVRHVKSIFAYLLISLLSLVPVFFVAATIPEKAIFLLISVIIMIIRMVSRLREDGYDASMEPLIGFLGLFVGLYIVGALTKNNLVSTVNYYLVFAYTILFILYKNITHLEGYLEFNSSVENIPVRQIRKNNSMILIIFLVLVLAAMILLPMTGASQLIVLLGVGLRNLISWILNLFSSNSPAPEVPEAAQAPPANQIPEGILDGMTEAPAWVTALYNSMSLAIGVVVGILILTALITGIYHLIKKFYRPSLENNDETVFLNPLKSTDATDRAGRPARPLWLSFDPNSTIRKHYRRMIYRNRKHIDRRSYTPLELEEYAGVPESQQRVRLHTLCEKARYSENGCTREDVQSLRG